MCGAGDGESDLGARGQGRGHLGLLRAASVGVLSCRASTARSNVNEDHLKTQRPHIKVASTVYQ